MSMPTPFRTRPFLLRRWHFVLAWGLGFGATGSLAACADDRGRPESSELRADPPPAAPSPPVPATRALAQHPAPLTGAGRRYQVAVGTAYFFDQPEQSAPNGRYLRRGDTFYGEGETNGFVKTGFVQPNGAAGTAWLKRRELRQLPGSQRPAAEPTPPVPDPASAAQTAAVQTARSYFYTAPDLLTPRKAYCERGDKVRVLASRGPAVYVTFTNWEKVTTTGWMRREALQ